MRWVRCRGCGQFSVAVDTTGSGSVLTSARSATAMSSLRRRSHLEQRRRQPGVAAHYPLIEERTPSP